MTKSQSLEQFNLNISNYGYSATGLDKLGASAYTLVTIVVDTSSSVEDFKGDLEKSIKSTIEACSRSPRSDNLMIRIVTFSNQMSELHGFKLLSECKVKDYDNCLSCGGMTALFAATENAIEATADYGKTLTESDFDVNAIIVVITDGANNMSGTIADVEKALKKAMKDENLESLLSILVGVGTKTYPDLQKYLDNFKKDAGLTQYVSVEDADAKSLAKLAQFISKSISAQSQALGSGAVSQQLNF
jgi:uncharacterized protein YegL